MKASRKPGPGVFCRRHGSCSKPRSIWHWGYMIYYTYVYILLFSWRWNPKFEDWLNRWYIFYIYICRFSCIYTYLIMYFIYIYIIIFWFHAQFLQGEQAHKPWLKCTKTRPNKQKSAHLNFPPMAPRPRRSWRCTRVPWFDSPFGGSSFRYSQGTF